MKPNSLTASKAKINGINLYYELHGSGDPLILIAGYTCDVSFWSPILEELALHFTVLVMDNRGAGRSDSPDVAYSIEMMAQDVVGLCDTLNLSHFHVLGHSLGGAIAQRLAYAYQDRIQKLIIVNSTSKFSVICNAVCDFFLTMRKEGIADKYLIQGMAPWLFSKSFLSHPELIKETIDHSMRNPYKQSLLGQKRQFSALANFDSTPWLKHIQTPTLIIAGDEDLLCDQKETQKLASGMTQSRVHTFSEQAHVPPLEKPQEFTQILLEFLKK